MFDYNFSYLPRLEDQFSATENAVVHLDTFESPQHDSTHFWRYVDSCDYSNHLDISSVGKSLVASFVGVWLKFERTFSMRWSPALSCSSPVQNTLGSGYAKSVCFQWLYPYLVTSDKHVPLQCDNEVKRVVLESWFRNPQNIRTWRKFLVNVSFQVGWTCKRHRNKARMSKTWEHYPTKEWWRPSLRPPTHCTFIPSSLCYTYKTNWTRDASALWRRPPSFCSRV